MHYLYETKQIEISKMLLALLIFSININLREPFFHTREMLFLLTVIPALRFVDYEKLFPMFLLLSIWGITTILNIFIPGSNMVMSGSFQTVIISCYLFLFVFDTRAYRNTIIKSYLIVSLFVGLLTITLWIICSLSEVIYTALKIFFDTLKETWDLTFCGVDRRKILNWFLLSVYYRTAPCMIPALGYCLLDRIKHKERKHTFQILVYSFALFFFGGKGEPTHAGLIALILSFFLAPEKEKILHFYDFDIDNARFGLYFRSGVLERWDTLDFNKGRTPKGLHNDFSF